MVQSFHIADLILRDLLHRVNSFVNAWHDLIESLLCFLLLTIRLIDSINTLALFLLETLAVQPNLLVLLLDIDYDLHKLPLLLLHDWGLFTKFVTICLNFSHGSLQLLQALLVTRLDLDNVVLTLLEQSCEDPESPHEEDWCEVQDMPMLLMILFGHFDSG